MIPSASHESVTPRLPARFDNNEAAYLGARLFLLFALAVLWIANIMAGTSDLDQRLYLATFALFVVNTGVLLVLTVRMRWDLARAMMAVIVPDLLVVSVFSYLGKPDDSFYIAVVLVPIFYALVVRRRDAIAIGVASALAYGIGIAFIGPMPLALEMLYLLKICVVPVATLLIANAVDFQRTREEAAEQSAVETEQLNDQLRRRVHELQAVSEITEMVHSSLDFDRVGPRVLDIVASVIGVDTCCIFVIDKEHSETLFSANRGTSATISDPVGSTPYAQADASHLTCIPVFDHGSTMVLFCASNEDLARLSAEERLVLSAVASELVVAVENSRLYKLTSRLAVTDELTGLANYRYLQQRLDEELTRSARYSKSLSLLMLDADDFKSFNDAQGHVTGDLALGELGPILRSAVREVDLVARYGGEEFSVVLPETDAAGAFIAAEKIREAVAFHAFLDSTGQRTCSLTMSIGIASYPAHAADKDGLLREADDALYHAKNGGKNRVSMPRRGRVGADDVPLGATPTDEWTGA